MVRRIGYFIIGMMAISQIPLLFEGDTVDLIFSELFMNPLDFVGAALLFLIGFLLVSAFFSHLITLLYLFVKRKRKVTGKDVIELLLFSVLFVIFFRFDFWLPLLTSFFAFVYSMFSVDLRRQYEGDRVDMKDVE